MAPPALPAIDSVFICRGGAALGCHVRPSLDRQTEVLPAASPAATRIWSRQDAAVSRVALPKVADGSGVQLSPSRETQATGVALETFASAIARYPPGHAAKLVAPTGPRLSGRTVNPVQVAVVVGGNVPGNEGRGVGATLGEAAIGPVPAAPYQTPASETRSTPPGSTKKSVSPRTPSAAPGSPAMVRLCQSAPSVELHRPNGGFPSAEPMTTMTRSASGAP